MNMPRLLHEIVERAVSSEPDMELVAVPAPPARRPWADADVLVVATEDERLPPPYDEWLLETPRARVVVVAEATRGASMYELRPARTPLGNVSPDALVTAIRASSRRRPA
jgi:hypothetical protein